MIGFVRCHRNVFIPHHSIRALHYRAAGRPPTGSLRIVAPWICNTTESVSMINNVMVQWCNISFYPALPSGREAKLLNSTCYNHNIIETRSWRRERYHWISAPPNRCYNYNCNIIIIIIASSKREIGVEDDIIEIAINYINYQLLIIIMIILSNQRACTQRAIPSSL